MTLNSEILEQPNRVEALLQTQRGVAEEIAGAIHRLGIQYVFLAARGTSDNAGRYANYLWGAVNGLPLALATPSLFTYYQRPPKLSGALVVGISQSGVSPDIVSVLAEGKRQGCPTLAITNAPDSPIAEAANFVLNIQAGPELAVAATKTYTAELMGIAMISAAISGSEASWRELEQVPGWIQQVLDKDQSIAQIVERYRYIDQCVVLGRGYNYATAFEWALKLKELAYVLAEPYSSADFLHGPVALVDRGFPVLAIAPSGMVFEPVFSLLNELCNKHLAELVVISDDPRALALAKSPIPLPAGIPEWLTPLVSIVPGQLFAYRLAAAKGYDTEKPRHIHKVTETR